MARRRSRRRTATRVGCGALALVVVLAAAVAGVVGLLRAQESAPPLVQRCAATIDGTSWYLDPEQADNAALVAGTAVRRGLPARAATIGLATALQESKLVNVDYGDRDSLGLFQQRPSQGWGTPEQILDPVYATGRFYDGLVQVDGYQDLPITEAAQAVQRSGFPDAYAQHEGRSRAWASALTGWSPAAVTCTLDDAAPGTADAAAVTARLHRDLGELPVTASTDDEGRTVLLVDPAPLTAVDPSGAGRVTWAVAQWGVAVSSPLGLARVEAGGRVWDRGAQEWTAAAATASPDDGLVRLTLS